MLGLNDVMTKKKNFEKHEDYFHLFIGISEKNFVNLLGNERRSELYVECLLETNSF